MNNSIELTPLHWNFDKDSFAYIDQRYLKLDKKYKLGLVSFYKIWGWDNKLANDLFHKTVISYSPYALTALKGANCIIFKNTTLTLKESNWDVLVRCLDENS